MGSKESTDELTKQYFSSPWDEFRNHPGQIAHLKWGLLRDFYQDVVRVNGVKLILLSELPQADKKAHKKIMREVLEGQESKYNGEVTRLLYNYLASAATLTDHCRYVMKDYKSTEFYKEYEQQVHNFSKLPESAFLKDLRNYFSHHKIPSIGLSISDVKNNPDDFRNEALIYTSDLHDSDKWSAQSKKYIDDHFPYVYIAGLIKIHLQGISELYSWIFPHFLDLHETEYQESLKVKASILNFKEKN